MKYFDDVNDLFSRKQSVFLAMMKPDLYGIKSLHSLITVGLLRPNEKSNSTNEITQILTNINRLGSKSRRNTAKRL